MQTTQTEQPSSVQLSGGWSEFDASPYVSPPHLQDYTVEPLIELGIALEAEPVPSRFAASAAGIIKLLQCRLPPQLQRGLDARVVPQRQPRAHVLVGVERRITLLPHFEVVALGLARHFSQGLHIDGCCTLPHESPRRRSDAELVCHFHRASAQSQRAQVGCVLR